MSQGADDEVESFRARGLSVFRSVDEIPDARSDPKGEVLEVKLNQITIRDPAGRDVVAVFRRASLYDVPAIQRLIALSARVLSQQDYSATQIDAALGTALGVDSQLIRDGTYFVAEADATLVACGGWSWRKTLFGSDVEAGRQPESSDPSETVREFGHSSSIRTGRVRVLVERTSRAGETRRTAPVNVGQLMATLPGERLYRSCGYESRDAIEHTLPGGIAIRFVPMHKVFRVEPIGMP